MTTPNLLLQTNGVSSPPLDIPLASDEVLLELPDPSAEGLPLPDPSAEGPSPSAEGPAPPAPDPLGQREQEIARREQEFVQAQRIQVVQQNVLGFYQSQRDQYLRTEVAQSMDPQQAQSWADAMARKDAHLGWQQYQGKMALERLGARETGVPQDVLANLWDENAMREEAARYKRGGGPQNEEVAALKRQVAELMGMVQRGQAPAQNFNQPGGAGRVRVTTGNIDQLYMGWERTHPNQPGNPYEGRYRKLLNGG